MPGVWAPGVLVESIAEPLGVSQLLRKSHPQSGLFWDVNGVGSYSSPRTQPRHLLWGSLRPCPHPGRGRIHVFRGLWGRGGRAIVSSTELIGSVVCA